LIFFDPHIIFSNINIFSAVIDVDLTSYFHPWRIRVWNNEPCVNL